LALCTGDNPKKLTYKNNKFHRVINEFMAQGGDITRGNGTGGESIYGRTFRDENLKLQHFKKGLLSMANSGPDTNGSQFFITFVACPWLNGNHCVFGELIEGETILTQIEATGTRAGTPKTEVQIIDCGEIKV
jgi:peptidylprolyl isomerase